MRERYKARRKWKHTHIHIHTYTCTPLKAKLKERSVMSISDQRNTRILNQLWKWFWMKHSLHSILIIGQASGETSFVRQHESSIHQEQGERERELKVKEKERESKWWGKENLVLLAFDQNLPAKRKQTLLRLNASLAARRSGEIQLAYCGRASAIIIIALMKQIKLPHGDHG